MRKLLLVFGSFVLTNVVLITALPSYGSDRFLGYQYWNTRCEMDYKDDWLGFLNKWYNGRTEYERENVNQYSRYCPAQCDCSNKELDCRTFAGASL